MNENKERIFFPHEFRYGNPIFDFLKQDIPNLWGLYINENNIQIKDHAIFEDEAIVEIVEIPLFGWVISFLKSIGIKEEATITGNECLKILSLLI